MAHSSSSVTTSTVASWTIGSNPSAQQILAQSCGNCHRVPPPGQPSWLVCTGCAKIRYCNVGCQHSHWPVHRPMCSWNAISAIIASIPTPVEPLPCLQPSFAKTVIMWALLEHGGLDNFPYETHYLHFKLVFRPDCEENASLAFFVESGEIRVWSAQNIHPSLLQDFGDDQPVRSCLHTLRSAGNPNYAGCLNILYDVCTDVFADGAWEAKPIYRVSPELEAAVRKAWGSRIGQWSEELRNTVAAGVVIRKKEQDNTGQDDSVWVPGKIVWSEGRWHWVQMTSEEITQVCAKAGINHPVREGSTVYLAGNT